MHSQTLYLTESLELLHLNYHHSNATLLDLSALFLLSYVRVTAGFSTLTRIASLQAWQNVCPDCRVAPHPLNICSSVLSAWRNWQLKICGTIQMWWLIFSSLMTKSDERGELWATTTTTTFDRVIAKILEIPMDASSWIQAWPQLVLIQRGLWFVHIMSWIVWLYLFEGCSDKSWKHKARCTKTSSSKSPASSRSSCC